MSDTPVQENLKLHRKNMEMINSSQPWGNGGLLPLGPLREPLKGLQRADIALFSLAISLFDISPQESRSYKYCLDWKRLRSRLLQIAAGAELSLQVRSKAW
ncbi:hypothetical protein SAY86_029634 [Trapa natans]|uniref:Uncharacterized protein n=1 Tax=Trapa natans TaxID=22666 RepID=A0AAN7LWQ0_TRANT|nr:hypothetical protein SAY86_029634 [Trapa natans]